ncbi:Uncharacterised protein [[Clostridium] sordellii]|uniref:DUF4397 domain-containing protein n=1 Tax=Paraclostridium sordellii TaxID=1505 RepID=A0ABM9RMG7_PARSO|nr:DUF4397 domain-containing protein [Paeniclostridium sordellii]EPZ59123.1 hypothetical protein H477_1876 [[Clostridium] sordellii ATCC 9714] [Paeniclostridium sordellii ATCC 9714]CEJ73234.1 hypothetical protein ATCC9714_11221 [[Clostridium] sordellii] [Paeniclostridium sordellii]CEN68787.1 Uncharacterised protein [[Clostridium] sordellii] [Paeniclostridium sordellii]CEN72054.1 Uncharacterised protein [[Clostridium] sordellii] [Paeniclostridium sordellii]CEO23031.1 Uncharacterised protein [[C
MDCFKTKDGNSIVRVFHASPNAPGVDVYIDNVLTLSDLKFTNLSDYTYLEEGLHKIDIHPAGDANTIVLSKMVDVPDDRIFTIAAVGNLNDLELMLIEDDIDEIPSTKEATFRVVHLSPNAPKVDVLANGNSIFENLGFKGNTDYIKVPSNSYDIDVVSSDSKDKVLSNKINLKANRIYTIYVVGNPPNLSLIQAVDVNSYLCR